MTLDRKVELLLLSNFIQVASTNALIGKKYDKNKYLTRYRELRDEFLEPYTV